jgi:hypothetical protein
MTEVEGGAHVGIEQRDDQRLPGADASEASVPNASNRQSVISSDRVEPGCAMPEVALPKGLP